MKAGDFNGNVDFNKNSILNAAIEPVTALPATDNFVGRMATLNGTPYWHDGSVWKSYPSASSSPPPNVWWIGGFTSSSATVYQSITAASNALKAQLNALGQNSINLRIEVFPGTYANELFEFPDGVELHFHPGASVTNYAPWIIRSGATGNFKVTGMGKFTVGTDKFFNLTSATAPASESYAYIESGYVDFAQNNSAGRFIYADKINIAYLAKDKNKAEIEVKNASLNISQNAVGAGAAYIWKTTFDSGGDDTNQFRALASYIGAITIVNGSTFLNVAKFDSITVQAGYSNLNTLYAGTIYGSASGSLYIKSGKIGNIQWNSSGELRTEGGVLSNLFEIRQGVIKICGMTILDTLTFDITPTALMNLLFIDCAIKKAVYFASANYYGGSITFIKCTIYTTASSSLYSTLWPVVNLFDCYSNKDTFSVSVQGTSLNVYAGLLL